ncbi:hypothetical protein E2C01_050344 [Portunus trituberculatus]|uniref:Uncharacterized protein n=1 Tax=Portunus trituberculatus TaxID=210409 RepID=A0A5B7GIN9_PORTR|nr:hypothetical protein [Portunus trituberculatus]
MLQQDQDQQHVKLKVSVCVIRYAVPQDVSCDNPCDTTANVPRYTVPPPARSEPIACLFGRDVSPTVPPAFLLDT